MEAEADPDAVGLGLDGALSSDAGTSMWAKSTRQSQVGRSGHALTISDMDNLVDQPLVRQLG